MAAWCCAGSCGTGWPSVSLVVFVLLVLLAFVGPLLWKYSLHRHHARPSCAARRPLEHPFGTDNIGHDMFARVLRGMPAVAQGRVARSR